MLENEGALLTRVRVPGAATDFSAGLNFQYSLSCGVRTAPINFAVACISICVLVKNPKHWQPYHCSDTRKYYTLVGMGSAALVAAVAYPVKAT